MEISDPLFEGQFICLAPIDHDKDPEIESRWTHDAQFMRLMYLDLMRPLSPAQVRKKYEALEKEMEEEKNIFHFTLRTRPGIDGPGAEERLVGLAQINSIIWSNGTGAVCLGLGSPADRGKGYGADALRLLLRYAFGELNLHRLTAVIPEYNLAALHLFEKAGFTQEVCRRQAVNRDGRRWDLFHYGLLASEWVAK